MRALFALAALVAFLPSAVAGPLPVAGHHHGQASTLPAPFSGLTADAGEGQSLLYPLDDPDAEPTPAMVTADGNYAVRFKCPPIVGNGPDNEAQVDANACPNHIFDPEDIMGQPILVVDPQNFKIMAFNALHGGRGLHPPPEVGGAVPPSERSRYNVLHQPHTTFRSTKAGAEWSDERYYAPEALRQGDRLIFGEDNGMAIDAEGRAYIASVYAWKEPNAPNYQYTTALWKTQRLNRAINYFESLSLKQTTAAYNKIDSVYVTYAPGAHKVITMWRESVTNATIDKGRIAGWVEFYTTTPGEGAQWEKQPEIQRVGPCRSITNPLAVGPLVYFGCLPDRGYNGPANSSSDRWQIHSLDPRTMATEHVSTTPLGSQHGILIDRGTPGYMIFIGSGLEGNIPGLQISYGALGANWQDVESYGEKVRNGNMPEGSTLDDVRVTAAIFTRETGYIHLLWQEHYRLDPRNVNQENARTFYKTYVVVRPMAGFQGKFDASLHFGDPRTRLNFQLAYQGGMNEDIFFDLHDSFAIWKDHRYKGKEKLFVTFGDYGYVRFAEVEQENALAAIILPPLSPPPIPVPLEVANPAATGSAAAALMGLMLLRLLAARRKIAVETTA